MAGKRRTSRYQFLNPDLNSLKLGHSVDQENARRNHECEDGRAATLEEAQVTSLIKECELRTDQAEAKLYNFNQNISLRKTFSYLSFALIACWIAAILVLIFLQGGGIFNLASEVLIAVVSTTTITVVGIFMVVARNIFPSREMVEVKS